MAKKKDCFGSETYVCRTKDCPYVGECVQVVWEKKLRRAFADKLADKLADKASPAKVAGATTKSVRVRSKEFLTR